MSVLSGPPEVGWAAQLCCGLASLSLFCLPPLLAAAGVARGWNNGLGELLGETRFNLSVQRERRNRLGGQLVHVIFCKSRPSGLWDRGTGFGKKVVLSMPRSGLDYQKYCSTSYCEVVDDYVVSETEMYSRPRWCLGEASSVETPSILFMYRVRLVDSFV